MGCIGLNGCRPPTTARCRRSSKALIGGEVDRRGGELHVPAAVGEIGPRGMLAGKGAGGRRWQARLTAQGVNGNQSIRISRRDQTGLRV